MLVNISTLLLQFEKCIVDDICDGGREGGSAFFSLSPGRGPQTKGLVKQQADFPTQLFSSSPSVVLSFTIGLRFSKTCLLANFLNPSLLFVVSCSS